MNWKKSDIPLMLNGFFVGMLFWDTIHLDKINLLNVLYLAGAYMTLIAFGSMIKNESEE